MGSACAVSSTLPLMRCPFCSANETRVIDSRPAETGKEVRRRRLCANCNQRFTTYERAELPLLVRKRDGTTEPLQVEKVESGIERALGGRMVSEGVIAGILGEVESAARAAAPAISSEEVGRIVLEGLKEADEVAYLRFASVYKNFQGAQDFEKEMAALDE